MNAHEKFDNHNSWAYNQWKNYSVLHLEGSRPYIYNVPPVYKYALSDIRYITLVLMHIHIQPPCSYKTLFTQQTARILVFRYDSYKYSYCHLKSCRTLPYCTLWVQYITPLLCRVPCHEKSAISTQ